MLGPNGGVFQWLFRRPVKGAVSGTSTYPTNYNEYKVESKLFATGQGTKTEPVPPTKVEDAKAIEAEIAKLQAKLRVIKGKPVQVWIAKENLPTDPPEFAAFLTLLADKKFGPGRAKVIVSEKGFHLEGDQEVLDWAAGFIKNLSGNRGR